MPTEATWTKPSDRCPHPEWWHAPDSDSAEDEVADLLWGLVRALQPEVVVETGTAHGRTASRLLDGIEANGHGRLVTYEVVLDRAEAATALLAGRPATVCHGRSLDAPAEAADLLFADSNPDVRVAEVQHFRPRWFVLHDTAPHHAWASDLGRDLQRLAPAYRWVELDSPRGVTFGQRVA